MLTVHKDARLYWTMHVLDSLDLRLITCTNSNGRHTWRGGLSTFGPSFGQWGERVGCIVYDTETIIRNCPLTSSVHMYGLTILLIGSWCWSGPAFGRNRDVFPNPIPGGLGVLHFKMDPKPPLPQTKSSSSHKDPIYLFININIWLSGRVNASNTKRSRVRLPGNTNPVRNYCNGWCCSPGNRMELGFAAAARVIV